MRECRQWRRQNGNYVQRRVSGTRTFGRRAARARCAQRPYAQSRWCVCVSINISRGLPHCAPAAHRWSLKCVYPHTHTHTFTDASSDDERRLQCPSSPDNIWSSKSGSPGPRAVVRSPRDSVSRRHRIIASAYTHTHTHTHHIHPHTIYTLYDIISVHSFHLRDGFDVAAPFLSLARPPPPPCAPHAANDVTARAGIKRVESHILFF